MPKVHSATFLNFDIELYPSNPSTCHLQHNIVLVKLIICSEVCEQVSFLKAQ